MNSAEAKKLCLSLMVAQTGNEVVNLIWGRFYELDNYW